MSLSFPSAAVSPCSAPLLRGAIAQQTEDQHSARLLLAAQILCEHGEIRLCVSGSSMLPTIFPGEVLTIRRGRGDEIRPGDIVLLRRGSRFIVHRAIRRIATADQWLTRGDALPNSDDPACDQEILGRVTAIERFGRARRPAQLTAAGGILAFILRHSAAARLAVLRWHALRFRFSAPRAPALFADAKPAENSPVARESA